MSLVNGTWGPALVVLVGACVAAAVYLLRARPPLAPSLSDPESPQRRIELKMEQLRELDADRHLMSAESFAAQRERLEAEAAEAMRARDTQAEAKPANARAAASSAAAPTGLLARSPQLKGALWGGGVVLFFVALGLFIGQDNRPRDQGEATGQRPPMAGGAGQGDDAELEALRTRLERSPDDVEAAARAAHLLLKRQDLDNAEALTFRGLVVDPFHTESRIHRALLRAARGDAVAAETELIHLSDRYPNAHEASLYIGMLRLQRGDKRAALEAFERFAKEAPPGEQPPMIAQTVAELRSELGGSPK